MDLIGFDHSLASVVLLMGLLAASGVMSGLAGFGFSAIGAASIWILPPAQAVPLLMCLSTANQLLSILCLRESMPPLRNWWPNGPGPYLAGGLVGLLPGVWILVTAPVALLTLALGCVLLAYTLWGWIGPKPAQPRPAGGWAALLVGVAGGVIGGFSAFPGAAVVVWTGLRGLPKQQVRAIVQPYILVMQVAALAMLAISRPGAFDRGFLVLLGLTMPVVLPLTLAGVWLYRRLDDGRFRRIALLLLAISGSGMVLRSLAA